MTKITASLNGQVFTTRSIGAEFAVVAPVVTELALASLTRRIARVERNLAISIESLGAVSVDDDLEVKEFRKELTKLQKEFAYLSELGTQTHYRLVSWHGTQRNAEIKARREGGQVIEVDKDL
jgi:hypothetical protein